MPGPARKPTAQKEIEGTARPDRQNPLEPRPEMLSVDEPPPAWLTGDAARAAWPQVVEILVGMRVATIADRFSLGLLCDAFGRFIERRNEVERKGWTSSTKTSTNSRMYRERPEVGQMERAWKQVVDLLAQYGLTAASRSKVAATSPSGAPRVRPPKSGVTQLEEYLARRQRKADRGEPTS